MDDKDDLYFSFDEEEEAGEEGEEIKAAESKNRAFLIGAIALAAVFGIGICVVLVLVLAPRLGLLGGGGTPAVSENEIINMTNEALFAATQTASFQTQMAPTATPTEAATTPAPVPSATPTSGLAVTVATSPTPAGPEVAQVTPAETEEEGVPPESTIPMAPTSGLIEVTPLGGGVAATPTGIVASGSAQPTGVGGPIQPTVEPTLPQTGFVGSVGLFGAGALAIILVAVVVIVRRLRLK
jgi:hypothetical protein